MATAAIALTGCGGSGNRSATANGPAGATSGTGAFAWLRPASAPAGWRVLRIPSGASLAYPAGWRRIRTDPGTASAALFGPQGQFLGYLNLTPRQASETPANWSHFRIAHNADEGDRGITRLAAATHLHFRTGNGTCVRDSYTTKTSNHYVELACLVVGRRATTVVVGAAPPGSWSRVSPVLERAISSLTT